MLMLGGYVADTSVLVKDIYRAGYEGKMMSYAYTINKQLIDSVPKDTVEGIFTIAPSPAAGGTAYARLKKIVNSENPDPYTAQAYDHADLVIMAMAQAKNASGAAIKDAIRKLANDSGQRIDNAAAGIKILAGGGSVNYEGASGPCRFTDIGDVAEANFRYEQIKGGKAVLLKIA
jgi:branched-chain amino acid transport system substrate-binding protein